MNIYIKCGGLNRAKLRNSFVCLKGWCFKCNFILRKIKQINIYMKNIKSFEDFINESKQEEAVNEASISSVSNKLEKTMLEMKKLVGTWKTEKDEDKKSKIKEK